MPTDDPAATTRIRLDVAYDGTNFSGWTRQPGLRTVQGELEAALATVLRSAGAPPQLTVAGRTDAGVHATGQVAHVDLADLHLAALERPRGRSGSRARGAKERGVAAQGATAPEALQRRLNGIAGLASDLHVARAAIAPPGFDARFSAIWRRYEYRVADALAVRNPLLQNHTMWHPSSLDVDAMDAAARALVGLHDWAAYCKPREGATTIRTLLEFDWRRDSHGVLVANVRADAFCHSMVRALVGASIAVGQGRLAADDPVAIRDRATRGSDFVVAPAKGLTLLEVGYPPDDELAARAEQTRGRRSLDSAHDSNSSSGSGPATAV